MKFVNMCCTKWSIPPDAPFRGYHHHISRNEGSVAPLRMDLSYPEQLQAHELAQRHIKNFEKIELAQLQHDYAIHGMELKFQAKKRQ